MNSISHITHKHKDNIVLKSTVKRDGGIEPLTRDDRTFFSTQRDADEKLLNNNIKSKRNKDAFRVPVDEKRGNAVPNRVRRFYAPEIYQ